MGKATIKDTKSTIFQAYKEALEELNKKNKIVSSEELKNDGLLDKVESSKNPVNSLQKLNDELDIIVDKYNDLKNAIDIKEKELKDIYDIERKAQTLEALVLSIAEIEKEKERKEKEIQQMCLQKQNDLKNLLEIQEKEGTHKINKYRQEQFDNIEKEVREIEKGMMIKQEELDDKIRIENKKLTERIEEVEKREQEIESKNNLIEELKNEIAIVKTNTIEEITNELSRNQTIQLKVVESKYNNKIDLLEEKITDKESRINELKEANEVLRTELKDAYNELKELASQAVDNSKSNELANQLGMALRQKNEK